MIRVVGIGRYHTKGTIMRALAASKSLADCSDKETGRPSVAPTVSETQIPIASARTVGTAAPAIRS
jgi:hypothetical protein